MSEGGGWTEAPDVRCVLGRGLQTVKWPEDSTSSRRPSGAQMHRETHPGSATGRNHQNHRTWRFAGSQGPCSGPPAPVGGFLATGPQTGVGRRWGDSCISHSPLRSKSATLTRPKESPAIVWCPGTLQGGPGYSSRGTERVGMTWPPAPSRPCFTYFEPLSSNLGYLLGGL